MVKYFGDLSGCLPIHTYLKVPYLIRLFPNHVSVSVMLPSKQESSLLTLFADGSPTCPRLRNAF